MRPQQYPSPTEEQITAIARLLVMRSRAGEFGRDYPNAVKGRGVAYDKGWRIGHADFNGVWLNHWQAALVALGEFRFDEVPRLKDMEFKRFPRLDEPFVPYTGAPTGDLEPAVLKRGPRKADTRLRLTA